MFQIREAQLEDIPTIIHIAEETWWPTYSPLLTDEQIRYMLDAIYNAPAIADLIQNNRQTFLMILDENGPQGFASFSQLEEGVYKLNKLYVHPRNHRKGLGKKLIDDVKRRAASAGARFLDLNVNRYNSAKDFYERIGFHILKEEDVPIGPYWMNDYVMRIEL